VAALEGVMLREFVLQRVQLVPVGEALDGRDLVTARLDPEQEARAGAAPIEEDRARAADTVLAPRVRAVQSHVLSEHVQQQLARFGAHLVAPPVDRECVVECQRPSILLGLSFVIASMSRSLAPSARNICMNSRKPSVGGGLWTCPRSLDRMHR